MRRGSGRCGGEVLDCPLRVLRRQMLEHLDAGDQVVAAVDLVRDRPELAVRPELARYLRDRIVRDVEAARIHRPVAQRLDEEPDRATCVEHRTRRELVDDEVGHPAEEGFPASVAASVRRSQPVLEVLGVVLGPQLLNLILHERDVRRRNAGDRYGSRSTAPNGVKKRSGTFFRENGAARAVPLAGRART